MLNRRWLLTPEIIFAQGPIIPVIVLNSLDDALPVAEALLAGGIYVLEITLRTSIALEAIHLLRKQLPTAWVGAGTIHSVQQLKACIDAGAQFAFSPGLTPSLLQAAWTGTIPFIPGAATVSELMTGMSIGYQHFKWFPAEALGGVEMLKAIHAPCPELHFCATGGIDAKNFLDYLSLTHVKCVGGSWLASQEAIKRKDWDSITTLALNARKQYSMEG